MEGASGHMEWEAMGRAAGDVARTVLLRDPAAVFAGTLLDLI